MKIKKEWIAPLMNCLETFFLVDDETKEIVWANDSPIGQHCYEAFFDRTEPCPFCPKLKADELYTWDHYDKKNRRWLKINNYLFHDGNRLLRAGKFNRMDDAMSLNHDSVQEISFLQKLLNENQCIRDELEHEAAHDRMTGLLNRNRFNLDIASGMYDCANVGVLYFDLNNLKEVNDTYRHKVGDRLICLLAEAIRQLSEENDSSECYRIGGDEFVLMLRECTSEILAQTLVRFRVIIQKSEHEEPPCIVAVGSAFSTQLCDGERLVSEADKSMYLCKKQMKSK